MAPLPARHAALIWSLPALAALLSLLWYHRRRRARRRSDSAARRPGPAALQEPLDAGGGKATIVGPSEEGERRLLELRRAWEEVCGVADSAPLEANAPRQLFTVDRGDTCVSVEGREPTARALSATALASGSSSSCQLVNDEECIPKAVDAVSEEASPQAAHEQEIQPGTIDISEAKGGVDEGSFSKAVGGVPDCEQEVQEQCFPKVINITPEVQKDAAVSKQIEEECFTTAVGTVSSLSKVEEDSSPNPVVTAEVSEEIGRECFSKLADTVVLVSEATEERCFSKAADAVSAVSDEIQEECFSKAIDSVVEFKEAVQENSFSESVDGVHEQIEEQCFAKAVDVCSSTLVDTDAGVSEAEGECFSKAVDTVSGVSEEPEEKGSRGVESVAEESSSTFADTVVEVKQDIEQTRFSEVADTVAQVNISPANNTSVEVEEAKSEGSSSGFGEESSTSSNASTPSGLEETNVIEKSSHSQENIPLIAKEEEGKPENIIEACIEQTEKVTEDNSTKIVNIILSVDAAETVVDSLPDIVEKEIIEDTLSHLLAEQSKIISVDEVSSPSVPEGVVEETNFIEETLEGRAQTSGEEKAKCGSVITDPAEGQVTGQIASAVTQASKETFTEGTVSGPEQGGKKKSKKVKSKKNLSNSTRQRSPADTGDDSREDRRSLESSIGDNNSSSSSSGDVFNEEKISHRSREIGKDGKGRSENSKGERKSAEKAVAAVEANREAPGKKKKKSKNQNDCAFPEGAIDLEVVETTKAETATVESRRGKAKERKKKDPRSNVLKKGVEETLPEVESSVEKVEEGRKVALKEVANQDCSGTEIEGQENCKTFVESTAKIPEEQEIQEVSEEFWEVKRKKKKRNKDCGGFENQVKETCKTVVESSQNAVAEFSGKSKEAQKEKKTQDCSSADKENCIKVVASSQNMVEEVPKENKDVAKQKKTEDCGTPKEESKEHCKKVVKSSRNTADEVPEDSKEVGTKTKAQNCNGSKKESKGSHKKIADLSQGTAVEVPVESKDVKKQKKNQDCIVSEKEAKENSKKVVESSQNTAVQFPEESKKAKSKKKSRESKISEQGVGERSEKVVISCQNTSEEKTSERVSEKESKENSEKVLKSSQKTSSKEGTPELVSEESREMRTKEQRDEKISGEEAKRSNRRGAVEAKANSGNSCSTGEVGLEESHSQGSGGQRSCEVRGTAGEEMMESSSQAEEGRGVGEAEAPALGALRVETAAPRVHAKEGRDSANHSPTEGMLASPRLCYSDVPSEDSSDSGKGCSDVPTPPSRTPASGSSVAGDPGDPQVYEFVLPQHLVGRLIGRHGCFVQQIKARTNASILIKRHPETARLKVCAVEGAPLDVEAALDMIRAKFPAKRYPAVSLEQVRFVAPSPLVPVLPDCLRLQLVEGISNDVIVSSVVSPAHFFLQQPTHPTFPALSRLGQCMDATYAAADAPPVPTVQAGIVVAAPVMGSWYRAEVVSVDADADTCQVRYVDYGGYDTQENSALRQIRSDFMTLPFQAAECYLANVCPSSEEGWSPDALTVVEQLTSGQVVQAQVCGYCEDGVPAVYLYAIFGPQVVPIHQELVARGMAVSWEPTEA